MKKILFLILVLISTNLKAESFSLECDNLRAIQFDFGEKLNLNSNAATDSSTIKYVFKNGYLYSRYPASANGSPEKLAPLYKSGFHNLQSNQEYYEFTINLPESRKVSFRLNKEYKLECLVFKFNSRDLHKIN